MTRSAWYTVLLLAVASCAECPCNKKAACASNEDCNGNQVCRDEACVDRGPSCITDEECAADRACLDGYCEPGGRQAVVDAGFDAGIECGLHAATCLTANTLQVCEVGRWAQVECARNGLTCADAGCRPAPCAPDAGAQTDAGPTRCIDLGTQESCTSPGVMTDCTLHQVCWNGRCATATGEPCNDDQGCAGGYCHCKDGGCAGTALESGYCSQLNCNADGGLPCPVTDQCMGLASAGGGRPNLCGRKADVTCPESNDGQAAGYKGPYKRFMPIPDPANGERYTFGDAVCFDARPGPVGATCAGPTECIGGASVGFISQCLTFGGAVTAGYCTHACDQTHACAPGAACVNRTGDPAGSGVCLLMCSQQRPGLATCNRTGLSCRQPAAGFTVLDGRTDALGFCSGG